jgi:hypothetical protein
MEPAPGPLLSVDGDYLTGPAAPGRLVRKARTIARMPKVIKLPANP